MGPRRPGSLRIIKPTSKAIPAKKTATTNKSRTTTDKGKKRATGDTEDSNECNDQQNSDDEEVVDPRKSRKKRHHATDSGASEETTGVARKKGRRGSMGKQKGKAVEHIDDDDEDEEEGAGIIEVVGDDDEDDAVVEEDLDLFHAEGIPDSTASKKDSTRDLLTVFSDKCVTEFMKIRTGEGEELEGRWCNVCREETEKAIKQGVRPKRTLRACFLLGSNSTCRGHIAGHHFEVYEKRCNAATPPIPLNFRCIPEAVKKARREASKARQQLLSFPLSKVPTEFTREGILDAVARHIACDDQPLMLTNKTSFRNCLVVMRPKTKVADLPSVNDVRLYLHNAFVQQLNKLKKDIENAPGKVSTTADGWTADNTKQGFLGMTAHWIDVDKAGKWTLRAEVVGFRLIHGTHAGSNLGRYFVGLCDRVGIMSRSHSKLYTTTLDNTSSNNTFCDTIESQHRFRQLPTWRASENQLPCLEHVVNLANVDIMSHITKLAAIETTAAIWEYDPSEPNNRVLGGGLDVIATIRTLAIKIQGSGQRIQKFESLQAECGILTPLKITLHGNTRWGSAFSMLDRAHKLRAPINLFISSADQLYGPITTLRHDGHVLKKLPWTAFTLSDADWARVLDAKQILADSNRVLHHFSADKHPTLYRALPALEELQSIWEDKLEDSRYELYHDALRDGLAKIKKYYCKFDEKPAYIISLILHPYFKLDYIKIAWGGADEQLAERAGGNLNAKNWHEEALEVIEAAVDEYWENRPQPPAQASPVTPTDSSQQHSFQRDFDKHRLTLLSKGVHEEGRIELRRYLMDVPMDVTRDTDIVEWWSTNAKLYPTLARIALDILPSQASSVPCERVFSSSKLTATDRRARLKAATFEELQMLKAAWRSDIVNLSKINSDVVEEVTDQSFEDMIIADNELAQWDREDFGSYA